MLQVDYDIRPDAHGVLDGRELARQMIAHAYALLLPYAGNCRACTDALFSAIANAELTRAHSEVEPGYLVGTFSGNNTSADQAAQHAHLAEAEPATRALLSAQNHAHH